MPRQHIYDSPNKIEKIQVRTHAASKRAPIAAPSDTTGEHGEQAQPFLSEHAVLAFSRPPTFDAPPVFEEGKVIIGNRLRSIREEKRLSQGDVGPGRGEGQETPFGLRSEISFEGQGQISIAA